MESYYNVKNRAKKGESYYIDAHSHPLEDGVPFSDFDFTDVANKPGHINLVITKSKYYALVVENPQLAGKFLNYGTQANTMNTYNIAYEAALKNGMTNEQASRAGVLAVVGQSTQTGIGFYETTNGKTGFKKIN